MTVKERNFVRIVAASALGIAAFYASLAAVMPASAARLEVDGGVAQYWELEAVQPHDAPTSVHASCHESTDIVLSPENCGTLNPEETVPARDSSPDANRLKHEGPGCHECSDSDDTSDLISGDPTDRDRSHL